MLRLSLQVPASEHDRCFARLTVLVGGANERVFATVRLPNGRVRRVELHWYEAHGVGRRDFKIKGYLDEQ